MERDLEFFQQREAVLSTRLQKVKARLKKFREDADKIEEDWNDEHRERFKRWNDWHDLEDKVEHQLWQNHFDYQSWHFEKYGFSVIDY